MDIEFSTKKLHVAIARQDGFSGALFSRIPRGGQDLISRQRENGQLTRDSLRQKSSSVAVATAPALRRKHTHSDTFPVR